MPEVVELGEVSDHAYIAPFPGLGLLCTSGEGAITLYNESSQSEGFVVHEAGAPITALACTSDILIYACGETLHIQYYRQDLGRFADVANTCTIPHAASVIHVIEMYGFVVGTDVGECLLFIVNITDEVELGTPLPDPIVLSNLNDAVTSICSSDTIILATAQNGKVVVIDVRPYFQSERLDTEPSPFFSTRLLCAENIPPRTISAVTRLESDICGGDLLLPGFELTLRAISHPQTTIASMALMQEDIITSLKFLIYENEKSSQFFSCVAISQKTMCSVHLIRITGDSHAPFAVCSTQSFLSQTSIVNHNITCHKDGTCTLTVITASINEGRALCRYNNFYKFTDSDLQFLKKVPHNIETAVKEIVSSVITKPLKEPSVKKIAKPSQKRTKELEHIEPPSNGEGQEDSNSSESGQLIALGGSEVEVREDISLETMASMSDPQTYNELVERFVNHVLQKISVQTGTSHTTSPALLVNFFINLGNTTLRSWDFISLSTRLEALGRSSRTFLCYNSSGSIEMSVTDNGSSFVLYCKSHNSSTREQMYTFQQPAIHASITAFGIAILRETSLAVYPYQDAPTAPEFKREWKTVLPVTLTPIACAIGDARFAAVSFTNRTVIAYCGGLVCYANVFANSITLLLMDRAVLFVLSEDTFYLIDIEARKTILTGSSPAPPAHIIWGSIDEHCVLLYSRIGVLFALNIQSIFSPATYTWVPILSMAEQERKRIATIHDKIYRFYTSSDVASITFTDISALRPIFYFPVDVSLTDGVLYGISTYALDPKGSTNKIATVKHISTLLRGDKLTKTKSQTFLEELRKAFRSDLQMLDAYPLQAKANLPAMGELDITSCSLSPVINSSDDEIDRTERSIMLRELYLNALLACSTDNDEILKAEKEYNKVCLNYITLCLRAGLLPRACAALQLLRNRGAIELGLQLFSIVDETAFIDNISRQLDDVFGPIQEDGNTQLVRDTEILPSGVSPFITGSIWAIKGDSLSMGTSSAQLRRNNLEKQYKLMLAEMTEYINIIRAHANELKKEKQPVDPVRVIDEPTVKLSTKLAVAKNDNDTAQQPAHQQKLPPPRAPKSHVFTQASGTSTKNITSII